MLISHNITTRRHNTEDQDLKLYQHENLKSRIHGTSPKHGDITLSFVRVMPTVQQRNAPTVRSHLSNSLYNPSSPHLLLPTAKTLRHYNIIKALTGRDDVFISDSKEVQQTPITLVRNAGNL
jgi:hypothetical protein